MKVNITTPTFICYIIFSLMLFQSCAGQEKQKAVQATHLTNLELPFQDARNLNLDPSTQIGEYFPDILQDRNGNFWFATAFSGLAKFNGVSVVNLTTTDGLPHNTILDLTEDTEGNIWMATRSGVSKYDGTSFINMTEDIGLASNWTSCILADSNGKIWVGSKEGVSLYDGDTFSNFDLPKPDNISHELGSNSVTKIMEDNKGNIWFGRKDYGVSKYNGTSFIHFTKKDGLYSNSIKSILQDKKGNMWFGSLATELNDGGLSHFDGDNFKTFPEIEALCGHEVWDLCEDKSGNIWIAPKNRGVFRYDGKEFTKVQGSMKLTEHSCVQSILEDKEGNMWFGYSGGIFRLNGTKFTNITKNGPWD